MAQLSRSIEAAAETRHERLDALATTRPVSLPRRPANEILEERERLALARCHEPRHDDCGSRIGHGESVWRRRRDRWDAADISPRSPGYPRLETTDLGYLPLDATKPLRRGAASVGV